jgi:DNA-binding NarL/FixJ family response regulator
MQPNVGLVLITSFTEYRAVGESSRSFPVGMRHLRKSEISDISQLIKIILETKARPLTRVSQSPSLRGPLTDKQIEVLRYINQGLSNQEIARQMNVTIGAVEKSISRINHILGFENDSSLNARTLLVKYFARLTGKDSGFN